MAEATITFPDGRKARISGPNRQAIQEKARAIKDQALSQDFGQIQEAAQGGGATFGEFALRRFVNNLTSIPKAAGEALAIGGAGLQAAFSGDDEQGFGDRFSQNLEEQRQQFPASALRAVPNPTAGDIVAGGQAVTDAAGNILSGEPANITNEFAEAQQGQQRRLEQLRGAQPFPAAAGETAGDVATILSGRAPRVTSQARKRAETRKAAEARSPEAKLPENVQAQVDDVVSKNILPFFRRRASETKRGLGRVAETGTEGAALALLNEGDPISTGMFAAGGQAVGSLSLTLASHPVKALLPTVATAFVASEMFKAATPGGQNLFESKDFAIQKATAALALGLASAAMGAGRLRGRATERLPKFLDAVTAVPRGAVLSRLQELTNTSREGDTTPLAVMGAYAKNPDLFTADQRRALGRAINSEKPGAFTKEVNRLMKNKKFREKLERMNE